MLLTWGIMCHSKPNSSPSFGLRTNKTLQFITVGQRFSTERLWRKRKDTKGHISRWIQTESLFQVNLWEKNQFLVAGNNWVCYHVLTIGAKVQCLLQAILSSSKSFQGCAHVILGTLERYGRRSGASTLAGNQRQKGTHSKGNQRQHFSQVLVSL